MIRHLCHIFSEIVELEIHAYLSVILQLLGNEGGFFQQKGKLKQETIESLAGNLYGSVRPKDDNRRLDTYKTHIFFDFR